MSFQVGSSTKREENRANRLEIYTLGRFVVRRGDRVLTEDAGRSYKMWGLFKYLLSYRSKSMEELMENLYPDEDLIDPNRTLRNLVYRLRRLLAAGSPAEAKYQYIALSQGLYYFNPLSNHWLDSKEFKNLCSEAKGYSRGDPSRAIELFGKALSLYDGYYLPESSYDDWVIPVRNYYHRLYLESVCQQIKLLRDAGRIEESKNICEKALLIEPLDEDLHLCFIDALLDDGRVDLARDHYNYASALLYRETGCKPSETMRLLYKKITNNKTPLVEAKAKKEVRAEVEDLNGEVRYPPEEISERFKKGRAFYCDPQTFALLCRLEEARAERNRQLYFWGSLALIYPENTFAGKQDREKAIVSLEKVLRKNLRRGDVVCRWNKNHFYLILSCTREDQSLEVLERIRKIFLGQQAHRNIIVRLTCLPIRACQETSPLSCMV
ncbi:MAG: BTAD domain-containing putative transcriptional regulator [Dethiobacteria bacterium]